MEQQDLEDEYNAREGDPRRCPTHGVAISSPDGMFDAPCGHCEAEMEQEQGSDLPPGWENAPLSAQIAFMLAGDDPQAFDELKEHLKGEDSPF